MTLYCAILLTPPSTGTGSTAACGTFESDTGGTSRETHSSLGDSPSIQSSMLLVFMYLFYSLAELYKFCIIWQVNGRVFSSSQITISEIWNYVLKTLCLRSIINIGYEICR